MKIINSIFRIWKDGLKPTIFFYALLFVGHLLFSWFDAIKFAITPSSEINLILTIGIVLGLPIFSGILMHWQWFTFCLLFFLGEVRFIGPILKNFISNDFVKAIKEKSNRVVFVRRDGRFALVLITKYYKIQTESGESIDMVIALYPTAPIPLTAYVDSYYKSDIIPTVGMPVEELLTIYTSGGLCCPDVIKVKNFPACK